jgi:N-acetylmuramoyl-L-alanine amidase
MPTHTVSQGECLSSIAAMYGYDVDTIWNFAGNASLKQERKSPNLLLPGDEVQLPEKELKQESGATQQRHRFRVKGVPAKLRIRVQRNGLPIANANWKAQLGGQWQEGKTDGDGLLELTLSPLCDAGLLRMEDGTEFQLLLRELDPLETVSGVQGRLNNLGYAAGPITGVVDPITEDAIKAFQADYPPLEINGTIDSKTRDKLKEIYGC